MDQKEKDNIVSHAALYGIDLSEWKAARSLRVAETIMKHLEKRQMEFMNLQENVDTFVEKNWTVTAVADATGLSRTNISRTPEYKAFIEAIKPILPSEVKVPRVRYESLLNELETLREWKDAEIVRQLKHEETNKSSQTLINENKEDRLEVIRLRKTVANLKAENASLKQVIEEKKLVINANGFPNGQ